MQLRLAAGGAAPVEARGGEGAGDWGEEGAGFRRDERRFNASALP